MMAPLGRVLALQLRQVLTSRAATICVGVFLLAGCLGLAYGQTVIARQRATLAAGPALEREHRTAVLTPVGPEARAGDQLYYLSFHTAHEPGAWAPFAIGLRDVQPFNIKIRMLAIHGQLYASDLVNPLIAAAGHFDAAFVLAWLAPLLVIALTHGLWAEEREQGTWALIRAQAPRPWRVLALTWSLRVGICLAASASLIALAVAWWRLPLDERLVLVCLLTAAHVVFWGGVAVLVASFGASSQVNALALLGLWLLVAVVGPGLVSVVASARHALPETLELTVQQRQGYHAAWDRPLRETLGRFVARYPAYAGVPVPTDTYSNAWYYAMQQAGDDAAAPAARAYVAALEARRSWTRRAALLLPPAAFQLAVNQIARTDLDSHLAYLQSVEAYHERLKQQFLPAIFDGRAVSTVDWDQLPRHAFRDDRTPDVWMALLALVAAAAGTLAVGTWRLARATAGD